MDRFKTRRCAILATLLTSVIVLLGCPSRTAIVSGAVACFPSVPPAPVRDFIDGNACPEGTRSLQCDMNPGGPGGGPGTGKCDCVNDYPRAGFIFRCKSIDSTASIRRGSVAPLSTRTFMNESDSFTAAVCNAPAQISALNLEKFRDSIKSVGIELIQDTSSSAVSYLLGLETLAANIVTNGHSEILIDQSDLCQVAVDLRVSGLPDAEVERLFSAVLGSKE